MTGQGYDSSPMAGLRPRIWRWVQSLRERYSFELDVGTGSGASASGGMVPGAATENWGWMVLLIQEKYRKMMKPVDWIYDLRNSIIHPRKIWETVDLGI